MICLILFQNEVFAQSKCESLFKAQVAIFSNFNSKAEALLLHKKDSKLHTSNSVEKSIAKHKRAMQETLINQIML